MLLEILEVSHKRFIFVFTPALQNSIAFAWRILLNRKSRMRTLCSYSSAEPGAGQKILLWGRGYFLASISCSLSELERWKRFQKNTFRQLKLFQRQLLYLEFELSCDNLISL